MTRKLKSYLQVTRGKIIIWGAFLFPYVFVLVVFQRTTPLWIQRWVYTSSVYLNQVLPSPFPPQGKEILRPAHTDFGQLTLSYFLLTYLWSCIIVESFGIIGGSKRARRSNRKK